MEEQQDLQDREVFTFTTLLADRGISKAKDMKMIRSWTDPIDETTEEISRTQLWAFP
jgi:hypothetical protein